MKNLVICLILCISISFSCKKNNQQVEYVQISIQNNSSFKFSDVLVSASNEENNYGVVNSYEKSNYKKFKKAYKYSFISLKIENEELRIQPVDYVGEIELEKGKHTYILDIEIVNNTKKLKLTYKKD